MNRVVLVIEHPSHDWLVEHTGKIVEECRRETDGEATTKVHYGTSYRVIQEEF